MSEDILPAEPDRVGCENMRSWKFLNVVSGEVVPARCARLRCAYCVRVNARRRGLAISLSAPERAMRLSLVGDDWATIRGRVKDLRRHVAGEVGPFEWVWHVEPNPKGTGHHVHAWQHGAFVPQRLLSAKAKRVGMGANVWVEKVRSRVGAGVYGLKGLTYGLKGAAAEDESLGYLVDNGWRLTHQSRGYFRLDGQRSPVRAVERAAVGSGQVPGSWVLIRA